MPRALARWLPAVVFALLAVVAIVALLRPADRRERSRLVGQALPAFALPPAVADRPGLDSAQLRGRPRLVNVFASWCAPCRAEAPMLATLAHEGVAIEGIAIQDRPEDVAAFVAATGNPYRAIGLDTHARAQIALGSSGVPETFVVDARGVVRGQHLGPIELADLPAVRQQLAAAR